MRDENKEVTYLDKVEVFRNETLTVSELIDLLSDKGFTSLGEPYVCIYEESHHHAIEPVLSLDFFLPYKESKTQVKIWRSAIADSKGITRNYNAGTFSWTAQLHDFSKRFGSQKLIRGILSESDMYLMEVEQRYPHLSSSEKLALVCVALILKEDIFVDENRATYKKTGFVINQIVHTLDVWKISPEQVLTIGIERFVYLCRIDERSLVEQDIVLNAPIAWLDKIFLPLLTSEYKKITSPSMLLEDLGKRLEVWVKA